MSLITAHVAWRYRLRQFANHGGEPGTLASAPGGDGGELGAWLAGAGRRWATVPAFATVAGAHAEFLTHAGAVVAAVARHDAATARALLGDTGALRRASQAVIAGLEQLRPTLEATVRGGARR